MKSISFALQDINSFHFCTYDFETRPSQKLNCNYVYLIKIRHEVYKVLTASFLYKLIQHYGYHTLTTMKLSRLI